MGRLAKTTWFLVKHSSAAEGEETRRTEREPKRRERIGPWALERADRVWGSGFFKRCKWPSVSTLISKAC
ncbi:hypothetical protein RHGRI_021775 [Rhododendron griersonianum]|uniref:Uncharacterized protein n=1 Tax=Rhododendron griersonianum TaxID=479676 RepID=A0AAV6JQG1_9ERIC|nr:hypothetical protein RHGRI_021775 [Rhododendron griersonianum]